MQGLCQTDQFDELNLCGHSEKLALGFGLISTPLGTTLRVTESVSVCSNCLAFMEFVSKLAEREIILRDAIQFHLFEDGVCSCTDDW